MTHADMETAFASLATELKQEVRNGLAAAYRESIKAVIEVEREHTAQVVQSAVEAAKCDCPLAYIKNEDVRHLAGVIKDIGSGDISSGIRVVRENHTWVGKFRNTSNKIANTALVSGMGIVVATVLAAFGLAIRIMIQGRGGV